MPVKILSSVLLFIAIAGCGGVEQTNASASAGEARAASDHPPGGNEAAATKPVDTSADLNSDEAIRRLVPISRYRAFPAEIRPLMQTADMEDVACDIPNPARAYRACNRRYQAELVLERLGWCLGGAYIVAELHWLRCSEDRFIYRPGALEAQGPPFSELEIAWADNQDRRERGEPGVPQLTRLMEDEFRAARRALAAPVDQRMLRRFPVQLYQRFPAEIRPLLQRAAVEDALRAAGGAASSWMAASNRAYFARVELARLGWCRAEDWQPCDVASGDDVVSVAVRNHYLRHPESFIRWQAERQRREERGSTRLREARGAA